jgi:hypothetical protein
MACEHIASKTKDNRGKTSLMLGDSQDDAIRLDCMIICNDWSITLKCSIAYGYIRMTVAGTRVYDKVCDRVTDRECENRG